MANSSGRKTKNWIYRLRHLRIQHTPANTSNNDDFARVVFQRNIPPSGADTTNNNCSRTNFRKSFKKMRARVKSVFKNNNPHSRHTLHVSSIPTSSSHHTQSRVTLRSATTHVENIYSLDPVKKVAILSTVNEQVIDSRLTGENRSSSSDLVSSISGESPVIPPKRAVRRTFPQLSEVQNGQVPKVEVASLSNCYWYWGPISRTQAEDKLKGCPDGAFLIRDSSSDRYIFSISFRSVGRILHTRIELSRSGYSLCDQWGYHSIKELIDDALIKSKNGIYCYTKSKDDMVPNYPVRLTLPISRYDKVPSLKYLSRFVIRQYININDTEKLPLPSLLIKYLQEDGPYF